MDDNVLVWDRFIEVGIYGFCIKVREFCKGFSNLEDFIFMSIVYWVFMIEVDLNMLVLLLDILYLKGMVSFFLNLVNFILNI